MRAIKPGDVLARDLGGVIDIILVLRASGGILRLARIRTGCGLAEASPIQLNTPADISHEYRATDWTAWAEAVGKLTDYLLALPAEVME